MQLILKTGFFVIDSHKVELTPPEKAVCELRNLRSMLYLPLIYKQRHVGVLIIGSVGKTYRFSEEEVNVCQTLANQAALEIEETRLFEDNQRYNAELEREIQNRNQIERELRTSEEKFRYIFESANVGKSITSPTGVISVNRAFAEMLGYIQEELTHKKWQELTPTENIEPTQAKLKQLLEGKKNAIRFEKRYIHKDGSYIRGDVNVVLRRDHEGKPLHFITTIVDITRRKQAEQAEKDLIQRIDAGLRAGNLAWWEMALPSGKGTFDNRKVELISFPPEMFKTYEDFTKLLHPDDYPKAMQAMRNHLEGKAEAYEVEYRIKTSSGTYK